MTPTPTGGSRRPARHESPVDAAIREAAERGAFDDLPGAGRPLPPSRDGDDFLRRWAAAEEDGTAFLPRSLQLRKEAHDLPDRVSRIHGEARVRELVADLNRRIADEIRVPTGGPPLAMRLLDADEVVQRWRDDRAAREAERARAAAEAAAAHSRDRRDDRRPWWRRRARRTGGTQA